MSQPDDLSLFRSEPFLGAVNKFEELVTQSGRIFLIGAGCSKCAGLPLTGELTAEVLKNVELKEESKIILKKIQSLFDGATSANIEDYLSEIIDLIAIAERRRDRSAKKTAVEFHGETFELNQLSEVADQVKRAIVAVIEKDVSIDTHRRFIKTVHQPLRPNKYAQNQGVDYLVLNYDTLFEDALALEKLSFADGLEGGMTGWWNLAAFSKSGLEARVYKLHGSITWYEVEGDPLPRRLSKNLGAFATKDKHVVIWPASVKYRETQKDPYAQLAGLARSVLRPVGDSQKVLVACGYSFNDLHINAEIDRALKESKGNLTVVAFSSESQPVGQLKAWHESDAVKNQVLIFSNRGFFHGDVIHVSKEDLLWWKFENLTRLLGGER